MTTLQNLIDACEDDLGDPTNATWAAADIEQWCRDAIADYSMHFPRQQTALLSTAEGEREYTIDEEVIEVISVEYPRGEEPPVFLRRKSRWDPDFYSSDDHYDITQLDDASSGAKLYMSLAAATDGSNDIAVIFLSVHQLNMLTTGAITVPQQHEHLLRNYVMWRAALQLKAIEEATPTSQSSLLMSQYAVNADRARRAYADSLAKALYAWQRGGPVSWAGRADESTRIY